MRSNLGGVVLRDILTLAALHLWPDMMATPYEWVGVVIDSTGLSGLINDE
ncbi:hypothetical protein [Vreelandella sulfidaeris]